MNNGIDTSKLKEWIQKNEKTGYKDFLQEFSNEVGNRVLADTKRNTPVDTGNLRDSWEIKPLSSGNIGFAIQNEAKTSTGNGETGYAEFIEYGHRIVKNGKEVGWATGYYMMTNAIDNMTKNFAKNFSVKLKTFIEKKGIGKVK